MGSVAVGTLLAYGLLAVVLYLVVRIFVKPLRLVGLVLYHTALGGAALLLVNLAGSLLNFHLALNPVSALLTGYLGLPGLLLLVAIRTYII